MKISIAATTDAGCVRPNNEDALLFCPDLSQQQWLQQTHLPEATLNPSGALLIVADGMGGANAGEVASQLATHTMKDVFTSDYARQAVDDDEQADPLLQQAFAQAAQAISQRISQDPLTDGMGTTLVACWIVNQRAHVLWCGDSRCYLYNPRQGLRRLTKDHSLVQQMVDNGEITEAEARCHPDNNIITRALGDFDLQPEPDITSCPLLAGDTLLLCTDGLCGYCDDQQLEQVMRSSARIPQQCQQQLMQLALNAGGEDNIGIVVATLLADDEEDSAPAATFSSLLRRLFGR